MIIPAIVLGTVFLIPVVVILTISITNIVLADTLILSLVSGIILNAVFHLHPVFCILAGASIFAGMTILYMKEKWFSVFEWISMLSWGYIASFITYDLSSGDRLWTWLIGMIVCAFNYVLHEYARQKMSTIQ